MIHAFEAYTPGGARYLLLDVESGAIHELDAAAFAVARAIERGEDPYAADADVSAGLVTEILAEFDELKARGQFLSPEAEDAPDGGDVIKAMCLHLAHDCNLRCAYCFASTGEYSGARMLMPLEAGKAALDFLIAHSGNRRNLEVDFFGGEPLMNYGVLQALTAYGRELEKAHDKVIRFTLTTNGLALTDERAAFINKEMHNVVLSLDGRKAVHDAMRPLPDGNGSYDRILPRLQAFVRARGDKEYYVRGTFTNKNLDFMEDVLALREAGFTQLSLEPAVLEPSNPLAIKKEHVAAVLSEYDRLMAYMKKGEGDWFNFFHFMLDLGNGPCLKKRISGCGAGTEYVAVTPEGDLYPCHQFVGEASFKLGNVLESFTINPAFRACNVRTKHACRACWAKYFCSGGCAANAWKLNGDIAVPDEITCEFERKRTECAIGLYA